MTKPEKSRPSLMVAPTGARRTKADHPALPMTVEEIAETAGAVQAEGAGALHLHVRDRNGRHSLDAGLYGEAMAAVRAAAPALALQITTESAGIFSPAVQRNCLRLVRPQWASIALRELAEDMAFARSVYGLCAEIGTRVQHILYTPEEVTQLLDWQRRGIVPQTPLEAIFVLGRYAGGIPAEPRALERFLAVPGAVGMDWMVCAFGPREHECLRAALARGGKVRIGFENNIHMPGGRLLSDNAQSVRLLIESLPRTPTTLAAKIRVTEEG